MINPIYNSFNDITSPVNNVLLFIVIFLGVILFFILAYKLYYLISSIKHDLKKRRW